jgi:hypothetical protein
MASNHVNDLLVVVLKKYSVKHRDTGSEENNGSSKVQNVESEHTRKKIAVESYCTENG